MSTVTQPLSVPLMLAAAPAAWLLPGRAVRQFAEFACACTNLFYFRFPPCLQLDFDPTVGNRETLDEISDNGVDEGDSARDPSAANQKLESLTEQHQLHGPNSTGNGSLSPSSSSSTPSTASTPCIPCSKPTLDRKTALYFGNRFLPVTHAHFKIRIGCIFHYMIRFL